MRKGEKDNGNFKKKEEEKKKEQKKHDQCGNGEMKNHRKT